MQNDTEVINELASRSCNWKFIRAQSPWYGGFWERMIALTKNSIKRVLGRAVVTFEELQTLVVEIESSLNDRPITFVSDNLDDVNALTPSQLLYGYKLGSLPDPLPEVDHDFLTSGLLNARQRIYSKLKSHFWKMWHHEYLLALRERSSHSSMPQEQKVKIGELVLIHDENTSRSHWKLGRIIEVKVQIEINQIFFFQFVSFYET